LTQRQRAGVRSSCDLPTLMRGFLGSAPGFSGRDHGKAATRRRCAMRRILLIVTAVLLVLVLSAALAGCRKSSGKKGGGGYLPAPTRTSVPAIAVA
jgi:hypothetical protein